MLFLLRGVSLPYFRKHWVITLLTVAGVALGTGVYIAIELSAASLKVSLRQTVDRVAGKTQLEISAGEAGFPEEVVDRVRAVGEVRAAQPVIEVIARPSGMDESSIMVLGVDFLGDRSLRDWDFDDDDVLDDPLIFLAQPDSICLTEEFARRHRLEREGTIALETGQGVRTFTIRGLIKPEGPATAFGGNVALMDLYAAQYAFSRGRRFDRIDVLLRDDVPLEAGQAALRGALGPGFSVDTPQRRGAQMEVLIANFAFSMSLSSWQAIFIAVFLIFNVFAVAAARRRREIGILRSLGVPRGTVLRLFLAEGAILGACGAIAGIGAGRVLAAGVTRFFIQLTEVAYGLTHSTPVLVPSARVLATGAFIGIASAIAAAFFPARAAAVLPPVEALAKGRFLRTREGVNRLRLAAGVLTVAATAIVVATVARKGMGGAVAGLLLANVAALLLAPSLIRPMVRMLRPLFGKLFGPEGEIAADALAQAPRRTSATVMALMVSVAFVLSMAGLSTSFRRSYMAWIDGALNADFYVTGSERFWSKSYLLPPEFTGEIEAIPGVRWVEPFRGIHLDFRGKRPVLGSLPLAKTYRRLDPRVVRGDRDAMIDRMGRGEGIVISDNFARLFGVDVGQTMTLDTPTGPMTLPVLGVVEDFSSDQGTVFIDRATYVERWKDEGVDMFDILLHPGADRARVEREIRERLGGKTSRLFVMTAEEFKGTITKLLDQFFALSLIQLAIALLVAVLGITNTLVISVAERRRELGILKALGTERRQVFGLVVLEALGIAICGGASGYLLGTWLMRYSLDVITASNTGWSLPFAFPWGMAAGLAPLLVAVTVLAALYPARTALAVSAAEALEFE